MSRREDFDNALWSDPDFLGLSPEARMTYIWSWTNPRCGMAGIYKVALSQAALEIGYTTEQITAALDELTDAQFAFYERNVLFVRTRARRLRTKSEQIAKSIRADLMKVADDHPLKVMFLDLYADQSWLRAFIGEGRASVDGGSGEAHLLQPRKPTSVNLTRVSAEPQPRLHGNGNGNKEEKKTSGVDSNSAPDDFPDELRAALPRVVAVLSRIAATRQANEVTVLATARAMQSFPRRPHLRAAEDLEHWLVHGTGKRNKVRDVVQYFRNQLDTRWQDQAQSGTSATSESAALAASYRRLNADRGDAA